MRKEKTLGTLMVSLIMMLCLFGISTVAVFSWFNGQRYFGKTMSYSKNVFIGAVDSNVTNYYGYYDENEEFVYAEIDPQVGFEENNLVPGSYIHIRTDITNNSLEADAIVSVYLQGIEYDEELHSYLYFGKSEPLVTRESYKQTAVYNSEDSTYTISSLPLLTSYHIAPAQTLSVVWYVYIDTGASLAIANSFISLGYVVLTYNS